MNEVRVDGWMDGWINEWLIEVRVDVCIWMDGCVTG